MAEKREIVVVIGPDGAVEISTKGLKGATCLAETEALEKALGTVTRRTKTREFYEAAPQTGVRSRTQKG